jgi:hypothetical protein
MMMRTLADFLLSEWLWSVTLGIHQVPIAIFVYIILLYCFMRVGFLRAVVASLVFNLFSWLTYSLFVVGILMYVFNYEYTLAELEQHPHQLSFFVPLALAGIYILLQIALLKIIPHKYRTSSNHRLVVASVVANLVAAWFTYMLLPGVLRG